MELLIYYSVSANPSDFPRYFDGVPIGIINSNCALKDQLRKDPTMLVELVTIDSDTIHDVIELELEEGQKGFIDTNVHAIAIAAVSKYFHLTYLKAICADKKVVGFAEYQFGEIGEWDEDECTVWRFMIDKNHQKKGIGTIAMGLLLKEIEAHKRCKLVDIYYDKENEPARKMYASHGFKETGFRDNGDVIAEIEF